MLEEELASALELPMDFLHTEPHLLSSCSDETRPLNGGWQTPVRPHTRRTSQQKLRTCCIQQLAHITLCLLI